MYKSIIFDIGGVLVDFDPKAYLVDRLCNAEMEEKVYDLTFGSEEWQLLDAGKLSRYDGNQRMHIYRRQTGKRAGRLCAGLCRHPDEGQRWYADPQPCHL